MALTLSGSGITSANIVDSAITSSKIADGAITSADIVDGTITSSKIADGTITSSKIADGTITNTDINASANIPASKLSGTGKVLQVVSYLTATQGSQTITTTDSIINGITKAITPLGANSKFLVTVRWFGEVDNAWDVLFNIHMNGVRVNINGQGLGYGLAMAAQSYVSVDNDSTPETLNMTTLVSTSSVVGTAITFNLVADAHTSYTLWNNRCFSPNTYPYHERGTSEIIITEIGA